MAIMLTKAVNANDVEPGNAIATVTKSGTIKKIERHASAVNYNTIDRLNTWYDGRIAVNPTYY